MTVGKHFSAMPYNKKEWEEWNKGSKLTKIDKILFRKDQKILPILWSFFLNTKEKKI